MANSIQIANEALAEIAADSIAAFDENSVESREAKRFFAPVLEEILDWAEWGFGVKRVVLAELVNDRPAEWLFCYAKPSDMASAKSIRADEEIAYSLPTYGPMTQPWQDSFPLHYIVEGEKIYTNVETASLVYASNDVDADELPPLVRRAFALELAARMAWPVKKDAALADRLVRKAEAARSRAMADEENKNPRMAPRYVTDAEYARLGFEQ